MTEIVALVVLAVVSATAGVYLARWRSWRLGSWTRVLARARTVEIHAGERRSFVRVDRGQWCENCGTSFWWVRPHPMVLSVQEVIFVLCERCNREMTQSQRLVVYARWWMNRYDFAMRRTGSLPELAQADVRRRLQQEFTTIRSTVELGL